MRGMNSQRIGTWPGDAERGPLAEAAKELWEVAYQDCIYAPNVPDKCDCTSCVGKRALAAIEGLLYPQVRSLYPERFNTGFRERLYVEAWAKDNERKPWLNSGRGILELLVKPLGPITQRDMDVATAVIQWLGTNVGMGFLKGVELQINRVEQQLRSHRDEGMNSISAVIGDHGIPVTTDASVTPTTPEE